MLIHNEFLKNGDLAVSLMTETGKIVTERLDMNGHKKKWIVCDNNDILASKDYTNWDGRCVKRINVTNPQDMRYSDLRQFMLYESNISDKIKKYVPILGHSIDIEIDTRDVNEFPRSEDAKYPILSVSITLPNLNTIVLCVKPDVDYVPQSDLNKTIQDRINDYMTQTPYGFKYTQLYKFSCIFFDSEADMLAELVKILKNNVDIAYGWNFIKFDWTYIKNRCDKLMQMYHRSDLDINMISPTGRLSYRYNTPKHKIYFDMRDIFKEFGDKNVTKYSLDNVADNVLGVKKVDFEGSYGDFIKKDFVSFLFYNAIDSILVQLIHLEKRYTTSMEMMANYANIGIDEVLQETNIGNALILDELRSRNMVYGDVNPPKKTKEHYDGAMVKPPINFRSRWTILRDYKSLYPSIGRSTGMSFENIVTVCTTAEEIKKYKNDKNYFISLNGTVYNVKKRAIVPSIWDRLSNERYAYKGMMLHIYRKIIPKIKDEIERRGLNN